MFCFIDSQLTLSLIKRYIFLGGGGSYLSSFTFLVAFLSELSGDQYNKSSTYGAGAGNFTIISEEGLPIALQLDGREPLGWHVTEVKGAMKASSWTQLLTSL